MKEVNRTGISSQLKSKKAKTIFLLILAGLMISIATRYFIIYTGIFSPGIGGLSQGVTYTIWQSSNVDGLLLGMNQVAFENTFFWIVYFIFNVPIIIFTYLKFGKKFLSKSLLVFFSSFLFTILFTYTPGFNEVGFLNSDNLEESDEVIKYAVYIVSALIGGIIYGIAVGLTFQLGGCSMGFDPISRHLSREKNINLSMTLFAFSLINSFIWITISEAMMGNITSWTTFLQATFFNIRTLSTLVFMAIYALIVGIMYPTSRKFLVSINTEKGKDVSNYFKEVSYHRGQTLAKVVGGYTNAERTKIEIVINAEEFSDVVDYVNHIDPKAFITTTHIRNINSSENSNWKPKTIMESKDKEQVNQTIEKIKDKLKFWKK